MRCVVVAAAALLLGSMGQVAAGDLPPPQGAPAPSASYGPVLSPPTNWSGGYLGVNGGYNFGTSNWAWTGSFPTRGGVVGGTLGINFPLGPLTSGVEFDGDWSGANGNSSVANCAKAGATTGAACESKLITFATARARLGYSIDRLLLYVTAGGAMGWVQTGLNPPGTFDGAFQLGWAAGGGAEVGIVDNWTAKAEYLYINLGSGVCSTVGNCGGAAGATVTFTESLVRAGINYKFSW